MTIAGLKKALFRGELTEEEYIFQITALEGIELTEYVVKYGTPLWGRRAEKGVRRDN